jgi:tetratricopeptide (TPR) repeat protein
VILAVIASATLGVRTLGSRRPAVPASVRASTPRLTGIPALQQRLRTVPNDDGAWAALGSAYVEQARLTGDPSYYPKAEQALKRSLTIKAGANAAALTGLGALAAARHDFAAALRYGEAARAINPFNARIYGVIGDAQIELGRYPEAFASLQKMVDLRPGLTSYARASYAWELQGNMPNARRALELALQAATTPADAAFASYYLGELAWNAGDVAGAARWYGESAAHDDAYTPALQGLAKVDAAGGHFTAAIAAYEEVVGRLPLPQYIVELGDLYLAAAQPAKAREQFDLLAAQTKLFRANGVNVDLEIALYDADHGANVREGLDAARAEWSRRKSVFVADALAWSLYANGRYREALRYAQTALHLGTRNASFFFHRGMIERALGMRAAARRDVREAIAINPHFSVRWAPRLHQILEALR